MTLYEELVAAGCEIDHHESDLYVKATAKAAEIIKRHDRTAERFVSAIDKTIWLDVPFAYDPFWRKANVGA